MYLIVWACQVISRFSVPFRGISRCPVVLSQSSVPAFCGPAGGGSTARPALPDPRPARPPGAPSPAPLLSLQPLARALIDAMLVPGLDAKARYAC
jgi:hypothetical protein